MAIAPPPHTRGVDTTDSWVTPKPIIDALGPFDLDPCAADPMPWSTAARMVTERENGLLLKWSGFVWCNPPYGKALGIWLERMSLHNHGIALVFARTDTQAFHRHVFPWAHSILFLEGRISFCLPNGQPSPTGHSSGGPSCLIAYGTLASYRLETSKLPGKIIGVHRG